jgi:hypothetical protein
MPSVRIIAAVAEPVRSKITECRLKRQQGQASAPQQAGSQGCSLVSGCVRVSGGTGPEYGVGAKKSNYAPRHDRRHRGADATSATWPRSTPQARPTHWLLSLGSEGSPPRTTVS